MGQFITITEIEQAVGASEFARLADPDNAGAVDAVAANAAIDDAEAVALSYAGSRMSVADRADPTVRRFIGRIVIDLAIWQMARDPFQRTDDRRKRYEDALALLKDIATGRANLPVAPLPDATIAEASASGDEVLVASRPRNDWSGL